MNRGVAAVFLASFMVASAQDSPDAQQRIAEYRQNTKSLQEHAAAYGRIELPLQVRLRTLAAQSGIRPKFATRSSSAQIAEDVLAWTSYENIFLGYAPQNYGTVSALSQFVCMKKTCFRQIVAVRDRCNHIVVSGSGYEGTLFQFNDPDDTGRAVSYQSFDGVKILEALLAFLPDAETPWPQVMGNTSDGHRALLFAVTDKGLLQPEAKILTDIGAGSIAMAQSPCGDIASVSLCDKAVWVRRANRQKAERFCTKSLDIVALAYDQYNQLYAAVSGQYEGPSRIVKLLDNGPGNEAGVVDVVSGGVLDIGYEPNSLAIRDSRVYFTNRDPGGNREILMWDCNTHRIYCKVPADLARGAYGFTILEKCNCN